MRNFINIVAGQPTKTVPLKDGREIVLHAFEEPFDDGTGDQPVMNVYANLGEKTVGSLMYDLNEDYVRGVSVDEDVRRLGIATALYDFLEQVIGYPVKPGPYLETDGVLFWANRQKA